MGTGNTRFVKPVAGALVRFPGTKTELPAAGAEVPWTGREGIHWKRREKEGSIIVVVPVDATQKAPVIEDEKKTDRSAAEKPHREGRR